MWFKMANLQTMTIRHCLFYVPPIKIEASETVGTIGRFAIPSRGREKFAPGVRPRGGFASYLDKHHINDREQAFGKFGSFNLWGVHPMSLAYPTAYHCGYELSKRQSRHWQSS